MIDCTFEDGGQGKLRHVAVSNIMVRGNEILLVKRADYLIEAGKWALPGGYLERSESMLECLKRETKEETGWEFDKPQLLWLNDNWRSRPDDRQDIIFVYFSKAKSQTAQPDDESEEQRWFKLDKLPDNLAFDHADQIDLYKRYQKEKFRLPIVG